MLGQPDILWLAAVHLTILAIAVPWALEKERVVDYPDDTEGARIARENRIMANNLSADERERLLGEAVKIIHKGKAVIEKPDPNCPNCRGEGFVDSGGFTPWGQGIDRPCGCLKNPNQK